MKRIIYNIKRKLKFIKKTLTAKINLKNKVTRINRPYLRIKNSKHPIRRCLEVSISSRLGIIFLIILILLKCIFFYNNIKIEKVIYFYTILDTILFSATIVTPLFFIKKNKNRFFGIIVIDILVSLILLFNNIYYGYSSTLLSISQINYLKYGKEISEALPHLLKLSYVLYIIDIPILLALWYFVRKPIREEKTKIHKNRGKRRICFAIIYLLIIIFPVRSELCFSLDLLTYCQYDKKKQVAVSSIFGYHFLDLSYNINSKKSTKYQTYDEMIKDYEEVKEWNKGNANVSDENLYGIAKGKNVIILQLESAQDFVIGKEINGKEITPNFNKFLKENIEFENMIQQSYSTTADSEYSVMASMYPLDNGVVFSRYPDNIHNDFYRLFKENGYTTSYMHGNEGAFWNRESVYKELDIDSLVFIDDFEETSEIINTYVSDESLYRQAVQKLKESDAPFMSYIVSASCHTAFELVGIENKEEKVNIDVGKYKGTYFGNYLESMNYADYAFGIFVDELKKSGLYDDTVIMLFGDHNGLSIDDSEMIEFIKETEGDFNSIKEYINFSNVLCGMRIPGIQNKVIKYPVSKIDIKPTLLQIVGIEDNVSLGNNMFSGNGYAFINNGHIITSDYYYLNNKWYEIKTGEEVNLEKLDEEEKEKLKEYEKNSVLELDISRSVIINELLK